MTESYCVRLAKEQFVFSSAHFITFDGDICERLHGHNYRVAAEITGPLDENHYVVDFIAARDALLAITGELDHHVLLPTDHREISVSEEGDEVVARFRERRWVFPKDDCRLLPVANTTAELLARHIGLLLADLLREKTGATQLGLMVSVDECDGQLGVWRGVEPQTG
ncbi:MAG: 6-pyruvoyl tetrahydropterin synthase family protein [Planctomycetota bacterium]